MVEFDIANVLRGIGGRELRGIRHSFLGLRFALVILGGDLEPDILIEGRVRVELLRAQRVKRVTYRINPAPLKFFNEWCDIMCQTHLDLYKYFS